MEDLRAALAAIPSTRKGPTCHTCNLPEDVLRVIHEDRARARPHTYPQLERFLATRGFDVTAPSLAHHFLRGHHTR